MNYIYDTENGELYHYGVKGMKWGVRKFQSASKDLDRKKAAYKNAKKKYNKSFNNAYNRSLAAYSPIKKHRQANEERWKDVSSKAKSAQKAKDEYKQAKKEFNKHTTIGQKINRGSRTAAKVLKVVGTVYAADVLSGGALSKTAKAGANYVKNKAVNKMFNSAVLDTAGKVIYRYNM